MTKVTSDFKDEKGKWVKYCTIGGCEFVTHSGRVWGNMRSRCKAGGKTQKNEPAYIGCTMSDMFSDFQKFTDWHVSQIGYGLTGYHLDKDLLVPGNKEYGEKFCVLVPKGLNSFLITPLDVSKKEPLGVCFIERANRYMATLMSDGSQQYLGLYQTPEAAASAYKVAKEKDARRWYGLLRDGAYVVDPRVTEVMRVWTHTDDRKRK